MSNQQISDLTNDNKRLRGALTTTRKLVSEVYRAAFEARDENPSPEIEARLKQSYDALQEIDAALSEPPVLEPLPAEPAPSEGWSVVVPLTEKEQAVLLDLAKSHELPPWRVMIQALRTYQSVATEHSRLVCNNPLPMMPPVQPSEAAGGEVSSSGTLRPGTYWIAKGADKYTDFWNGRVWASGRLPGSIRSLVPTDDELIESRRMEAEGITALRAANERLTAEVERMRGVLEAVRPFVETYPSVHDAITAALSAAQPEGNGECSD